MSERQQPRIGRGTPAGGRWTARWHDDPQTELQDPAVGEWPAVGYEERHWEPNFDLGRLDVYQRIKASGPYRSAVPPTIGDAVVRLPAEVVGLADEATSEVVRFDADMAHLPITMPAVLLRTESASSSQIEHLTASAKNIAVAEAGLRSTDHAELVVANSRAMLRALEIGRHVDADTILEIHRRLMDHSEPAIAGRWRTVAVWVGPPGTFPHTAEFVPPHHERIPELIDDLAVFAARADVPPLVSAALVHAQFETIHPFEDGNGRVGRALVHTQLKGRGVTRNATVPVSAGLLRATSDYYRALDAYRAGDPAAIVEQMAHAALAAAANGRELARDLLDIRQGWQGQLRARADSSAWKVLDLAVAHPVLTPPMVARKLGITERAARTALVAVEESGALTLTTTRKRDRVWHAPAVLAAMQAFEARAGRRVNS